LLMFLNIGVIAGAVLARQFKVMILAPAVLLAGALDLFVTIARQYELDAVALVIVVTTIGLEIGYLLGLSIQPPSRRI
jgi:hypothetical protein